MLKLLAVLLLYPTVPPPQDPALPIAGTWQVTKGNVKGDGPRSVVIRSDSSASWGKETVRWRLTSDSIRIAIGGEWETYKLKVGKDQLTLSGGDLSGPITLKRIGPPTPRANGVMVPRDPDDDPPAS